MGLFSAIGSFLGGRSAKRASRRAQAAQEQAFDRAVGELRRQSDLTRADYAPARDLLAPSLSNLADIIGINGEEAQRLALTGIQSSPEFTNTIQSGEEAILANASATGGLRGGNVKDFLSRFRGDTYTAAIQERLRRLGGLAGLGMGATDSSAAFGADAANNIAQNLVGRGAASAQGLLTRGGINAQMWNNAGGFSPGGLVKRLGQIF
ncbi:hypothetical protein UFOVP407_59 [uncultured Caudovirales phage]|uniref:DNA transfer protein n=1 Tax=uncultured Caudovirales phage TaxID=2100421 RepID=A0A6J5M0Q5_9CAUD|nr:hypothetical protein UFOVP407_59 [uncultured Caudovirales phage]